MEKKIKQVKIVFDERGYGLETFFDNGIVSYKPINPADVTNIFKEEEVVEEIVPKGLFYKIENKNKGIYFFEREKTIKKLKITERGSGTIKEFELPIPNFFMAVIFDKLNQRVTETYLYCSANPFSSTGIDFPNTLYGFPYGNVFNDGRICWGSNSNILNLTKNILQCSKLPDAFLDTPYNGDLLYEGFLMDDENSIMDVAYNLSGKKEFPISKLVRKDITFKNLVIKLKKRYL